MPPAVDAIHLCAAPFFLWNFSKDLGSIQSGVNGLGEHDTAYDISVVTTSIEATLKDTQNAAQPEGLWSWTMLPDLYDPFLLGWLGQTKLCTVIQGFQILLTSMREDINLRPHILRCPLSIISYR